MNKINHLIIFCFIIYLCSSCMSESDKCRYIETSIVKEVIAIYYMGGTVLMHSGLIVTIGQPNSKPIIVGTKLKIYRCNNELIGITDNYPKISKIRNQLKIK